MTHVVAGLGFAAFVASVVLAALRPGYATRSAVILCVLAVSGLAGASRRDLWPFSAWQLMVTAGPVEVGADGSATRIILRSADQRPYLLDHRAIEPLDLSELHGWLLHHETAPDSAVMAGMCRYVLERSEAARQRVASGRGIGHSASLLGPLTAPQHLGFPKVWASPADVPSEPFRSVEIYREYFDIDARWTDSTAHELRLLHACGPGR